MMCRSYYRHRITHSINYYNNKKISKHCELYTMFIQCNTILQHFLMTQTGHRIHQSSLHYIPLNSFLLYQTFCKWTVYNNNIIIQLVPHDGAQFSKGLAPTIIISRPLYIPSFLCNIGTLGIGPFGCGYIATYFKIST